MYPDSTPINIPEMLEINVTQKIIRNELINPSTNLKYISRPKSSLPNQ
jgi:hypothetical protein